MSKQVRAILFDLDGTLVDSFPAIEASVNHVRSLHSLEPLPLEAVKRCVGNGLTRLLELTCPAGEPGGNAEAFTEHHARTLMQGTLVLPEVHETLRNLKEREVQLAVCSNKPVELSRQLLQTFDLATYMTAILGPESVPRRKPDPDMLWAALSQLKVQPSQALYVGDMTIDIATARAAGIEVWVIPTGSQDRATLAAASPDRMLQHFRELLDVVAATPPRTS